LRSRPRARLSNGLASHSCAGVTGSPHPSNPPPASPAPKPRHSAAANPGQPATRSPAQILPPPRPPPRREGYLSLSPSLNAFLPVLLNSFIPIPRHTGQKKDRNRYEVAQLS